MSGPITKSAADMIMDARRTKLWLTLKLAYEDNHIAQDLVLIQKKKLIMMKDGVVN